MSFPPLNADAPTLKSLDQKLDLILAAVKLVILKADAQAQAAEADCPNCAKLEKGVEYLAGILAERRQCLTTAKGLKICSAGFSLKEDELRELCISCWKAVAKKAGNE